MESEYKVTRYFQNSNCNTINTQMGVEFIKEYHTSSEEIELKSRKFYLSTLLKKYTDHLINKVKKKVEVTSIDIFITDQIQNVDIENKFFEERLWGRVKVLVDYNNIKFSIVPPWHPFPDYCNQEDFDRLANEIIEHCLMIQPVYRSIEFESNNIPILFTSPSSGFLLHEVFGHLLEADFFISSPFKKYKDKSLGPKELTIIDDGTLGLHSISKYDDEGTELKKTHLISKGILKTSLVDKNFSSLLDTPLTGNGWRNISNGTISPRMTTIYAQPGKYNLHTLMNSLEKGIIVYSLQGGQVDITTGNFTLYTEEAYLVENGVLTYKINPTIIYGEAIDSLKNIVGIGNDLKFTKMICGKLGQFMPVGIGGPSLLVEELNVGRVFYDNKSIK